MSFITNYIFTNLKLKYTKILATFITENTYLYQRLLFMNILAVHQCFGLVSFIFVQNNFQTIQAEQTSVKQNKVYSMPLQPPKFTINLNKNVEKQKNQLHGSKNLPRVWRLTANLMQHKTRRTRMHTSDKPKKHLKLAVIYFYRHSLGGASIIT